MFLHTEALNKVLVDGFIHEAKMRSKNSLPTSLTDNINLTVEMQEVCNGVVHPITKQTITKYEELANNPELRDVWTKAMCKELGNIAQGYDETKGIDTVRFLNYEQISKIPKDRTVTYAHIVIDYRPQKEDPN